MKNKIFILNFVSKIYKIDIFYNFINISQFIIIKNIHNIFNNLLLI